MGTNELYLLEKLAADPHFRGTAIVSFVPSPDLPAGARGDALSCARLRALRARIDLAAGELAAVQWLDARLAFLDGDELTLKKLIEQLELPQRAGAEGEAMFLPALVTPSTRSGRGRMLTRSMTDAVRREQIEATWVTPIRRRRSRPRRKRRTRRSASRCCGASARR